MPNGKAGDNPLTDMLHHGAHPFPADVETMIRRIHAVKPTLLSELGWSPFDWAQGEKLDEARAVLRRLLDQT